MDELRRPLFFLALALIAAAVLIEVGAVATIGGGRVEAAVVGTLLPPGDVRDAFDQLDENQREQLAALASQDKPPGIGIPSLALLDGIVLFTLGLIGAGLLVPQAIQGRIQGIITLAFSLLLLLGTLALAAAALARVTLMVALLSAAPFGTLTYLALFGFFNRTGAAAVLSLLMLLKLGVAAGLVLAQQRFIQNKGLVALLVTSIVGNLVVSFLHGLVPGFLVSLTDSIAALIIAILVLLWLAPLLLGSAVSMYRSLQPG